MTFQYHATCFTAFEKYHCLKCSNFRLIFFFSGIGDEFMWNSFQIEYLLSFSSIEQYRYPGILRIDIVRWHKNHSTENSGNTSNRIKVGARKFIENQCIRGKNGLRFFSCFPLAMCSKRNSWRKLDLCLSHLIQYLLVFFFYSSL